MDMAEHSICQPGRPGPQGLSQYGSSGLAAFHRTKSGHGLPVVLVLLQPPELPGAGGPFRP